MKFPIETQQFAARLTNEDLTLINELIPELLPDRDLSDNSLTGREIITALAETASLKLRKMGQSQPADLQRITELENLLSTEKEVSAEESKRVLKYQSKIDELIAEFSQLEARNLELETELSGISTQHTEVSEKARTLEKYAPVPNEMRIIVEPLTAKVLALYAEKIRMKNKSDATPGEILTSLFNRYITKRETELPGFPFLVSKSEIITLSNETGNE